MLLILKQINFNIILICFFRFGDSLPADGLVGVAVVAEPSHGCGPIKPPPDTKLPHNVFWIVMIKRSIPGTGNSTECTFQVWDAHFKNGTYKTFANYH